MPLRTLEHVGQTWSAKKSAGASSSTTDPLLRRLCVLRARSLRKVLQHLGQCISKSIWLSGACFLSTTDGLTLAGAFTSGGCYTSLVSQTFAHLVRTEIPICAPTPAPIALTIKKTARPASVIVVTPLTLQKTARSSGESISPTHTTTVTPIAAHVVAQTSTMSASLPTICCG